MNGCATISSFCLLSGLVALLGGCQPDLDQDPNDADVTDSGEPDVSYDADDGQPPVDGDVTDEDDGICTDLIDVVFVLDVSSSMRFVLNQLEAQIESVILAANALAEGSHFGLIPFVDNFAVDTTGDLEEDSRVHTAAGTLQAAFHHYRENYTQPNRNPGDGLDGPTTQNPICEENALDALYAAATEFPWRESATRVVILATDDTFLEAPDNYGDRDGDGDTTSTDYPREGDYPALRTVEETIEELQAARVRVFTFTRLRPPGILDLTRCGTGRRLQWQDITDGWTTDYNGFEPIPDVTDAENFDLDQVRNGSLSLSATINEVVVDSYCHEPIY